MEPDKDMTIRATPEQAAAVVGDAVEQAKRNAADLKHATPKPRAVLHATIDATERQGGIGDAPE